jgi:tellurite resistance-related uncharacterized protein
MSADLELPDGVELVRTTEEFTDDTAPAGLRRAHRVAKGVWGRLVVRSGAVEFVFEDEDEADQPIAVAAGGHQVIPPDRAHRVVFDGPATFVVEFYRLPDEATAAPVVGEESTGLTGGDNPQAS